MALLGFEKDTWLDLTVNLIPLAIMGFFVVAFLIVPSWGVDPVFSGMQFAIIGSMIVSLAILTYYAGKAIEGAEAAEAAAAAETATAPESGEADVDPTTE